MIKHIRVGAHVLDTRKKLSKRLSVILSSLQRSAVAYNPNRSSQKHPVAWAIKPSFCSHPKMIKLLERGMKNGVEYVLRANVYVQTTRTIQLSTGEKQTVTVEVYRIDDIQLAVERRVDRPYLPPPRKKLEKLIGFLAAGQWGFYCDGTE